MKTSERVAKTEQLLLKAAEVYNNRAAMSCSFGGLGGLVLVHIVSKLELQIPIIFLDTGFLFPETIKLKDTFKKRYGVQIRTFKPHVTYEQQRRIWGDRLWEKDPDLCCKLRKVEPMQKAIKILNIKAWITAIRRDQSPSRKNIAHISKQLIAPNRYITKFSPIVDWNRQQVWDYIHQNRIPYNPLLTNGYSSLGCRHCTTPNNSNQDERAGRLPGIKKTECGLHTRHF